MANLIHRAGTELSAITPEKWSANYYATLLEALPFASLIDNSYEGDISDVGDTVNISQFPEFAAATLIAEDDCPDADAVTVATQQLVIDKQVVKDFIVTRKATLQSLPHMDQLQDLAIFAVMKKIQEEIITATVPAVANQLTYTVAGTLDLGDILAGKEKLDAANVPMSDRHMVVDAPQWNDIFNIVGFTSSDFLLAGAPLQTGQVPTQLLGFMPHMTTAASATTYLFHRSYMTIATQQGMNVQQYDRGAEGCRQTRVNVDTCLGIKQLDDLRVVSIS